MKALNEIPEAWRLAMQRERDAEQFYARMAQAATDKATRSLFETLVEQEQKHHAILEAEYRRIFEPDLETAREQLPVTWYEWDDESFELAATLELPVMLYLTAPWCEPCHLMDRTTLADRDVAAAINGGFIPIRVDADKRPDIDSRYGKGGWPTIAFLDASGELLESHNYLTAEEMSQALQRIQSRYAGESPASAPAIAVRGDADLDDLGEQPAAVGGLRPELPEQVAQLVIAAFDREHGGFGSTPKFHHADLLEFLLAIAHRTGDEHLNQILHTTLDAMAGGAIHDPIAGGFFRYAGNADWSAPHYEKMLGDQAQLLALYLRAYQATGREHYLDTARRTLAYTDTVLWDQDRGYFYSSQEADPAYYALDAQSRAGRPAPYVDTVLYTARNAAAASAYMLAAAVLDEPRYADLAIRALETVWQKSYQEGLGLHHYVDTRPRVPGLLRDQVAMALSWLDAYEHSGREVYLQRAEVLMRFVHNALRDSDNRYFDTLAAPEAVGRMRQREKPFRENVLAAEAHLRLHRLTGQEPYRLYAQSTLEALLPYREAAGINAARLALTIDRFLRRPLLITVVGENEDPLRAELLRAGRRAYASNKAVQAVDPVWEPGRLARLGYPAEPAPAAYACLGSLCSRPTADPNQLVAQAQAMLGQDRRGRERAWQYKGYSVDEGFKPEPRDRYQYFFRVLQDGERVFRYCIWTSKEAVAARWPGIDLATAAGRADLEARLKAEGHRRIQAKIDAGALANWVLDLQADGEQELSLEERNA